ncbi:hypothetical protein E4U55_006410 [Claviceps digitariae]|nr:hypothetical protein E4U55_006410 [Claviceps digitariae]
MVGGVGVGVGLPIQDFGCNGNKKEKAVDTGSRGHRGDRCLKVWAAAAVQCSAVQQAGNDVQQIRDKRQPTATRRLAKKDGEKGVNKNKNLGEVQDHQGQTTGAARFCRGQDSSWGLPRADDVFIRSLYPRAQHGV